MKLKLLKIWNDWLELKFLKICFEGSFEDSFWELMEVEASLKYSIDCSKMILKFWTDSEFLNEWGALKWLMLLNNWNWIFERNGALTGLKLWSCLEIIGAALKCSQFCGIDLLKFLGFFESVDAMLFCFSVVRYFFDQSDNTLYQRWILVCWKVEE